ncbi:hypothetical protein T484DRAFT_2273029 [Baffinella frigidus]|nr:hypothetical protein T484DRAFT_2273029 [Cryptophyta sp. CCMP2293]
MSDEDVSMDGDDCSNQSGSACCSEDLDRFEEEDGDVLVSSHLLKDPFTALTADSIAKEQRKNIEAVMDLTELPPQTSRQLLQQMRWNYEKLAELYFEDPEALLSKAGAVVRENAVRELSGSAVCLANSQEERMCSLCCDTFEGCEANASMTALEACGHLFCNDCWRRHLKIQIEDEGQAAKIHCAGMEEVKGRMGRCSIVVDERVVEKLLRQEGGDPDLFKNDGLHGRGAGGGRLRLQRVSHGGRVYRGARVVLRVPGRVARTSRVCGCEELAQEVPRRLRDLQLAPGVPRGFRAYHIPAHVQQVRRDRRQGQRLSPGSRAVHAPLRAVHEPREVAGAGEHAREVHHGEDGDHAGAGEQDVHGRAIHALSHPPAHRGAANSAVDVRGGLL